MYSIQISDLVDKKSFTKGPRQCVDNYVNFNYCTLMNKSTTVEPSELLDQMSQAAKARFSTDASWAKASGVPKETLSRLKSQSSCGLRTLGALAHSAGYTLVAVPAATQGREHVPERFGRDYEDKLLDLAASGNADPNVWRAHGPGFFMGGLAVMLASARGFERERYLRLAETLHLGVSTPEVFQTWLKESPVRPSRFLPMARRRRRLT
jgi:hypothetical protein